MRGRTKGPRFQNRREVVDDGSRQVHAKRPPVFPAGGLVDPTLGYPARGPTSWRRRAITAGYCENQVTEGRYSVGGGRYFGRCGVCATKKMAVKIGGGFVRGWGMLRRDSSG